MLETLTLDSGRRQGRGADGTKLAFVSHVSRRSRCRLAPSPGETDPIKRARRLFGRGEARRALVLLRDACSENEQDARLWAIYGIACHRQGKQAEALQALKHAAWVRQRAQQTKRAHSLRQIIARLGLARAA